ncbi:multivesicular body subunit 12B-like [Limulus polyphemus]|uniref:Multivesicular body subunit 12B-like n=1 Tax=Limulus polyphemus TaxID=6850 RepID=A0ABM1BAP6_LIMPO|nr:multivesicular body subunit 12B-like [Limulus polyphemus]XP_022245891.1 multivesicular body subunit 12B-like [Limulus polyphemus]XP_022245892.1 multivesicular body subunit 12B-like [Limulus polyphemus]XP_022245893.1 multivesicular body subunit 12B-like [Limulus polyphemus]XP_022245894.1 multivesicular body subunit 12B-like [Limulus polyphemus]XP_022245896.1 multivesicular body subunit 12B-like [Limulus polyphemus]
MDLQSVLKALPDDRPVTRICIVEDPTKCPSGFQLVAKTFDQDTDADLWKDGIFGKRITRYICFMKDQSSCNEVVESITVAGERELPPEWTALLYTQDSEQKAIRKKNLCYKLVSKDLVQEAVTDIIVLSKSKKPPPGFTLAGEINSLLICYKCGPVSPARFPRVVDPLPYSLLSNGQQVTSSNWGVSSGQSQQPYVQGQRTLYGNSITHNAVLDGVPFTINPKYSDFSHLLQFIIPDITFKTEDQLRVQYNYSFQVEYQVQQAVSSNFS